MNFLNMDPMLRIRQNHALEHATMHVLARRDPGLRLMGRSTSKGFYVYGTVDTQTLANAASEALARLQAGERELAVHPRCGTNVATAGILAGLAGFAAMQGRRKRGLDALPNVLLATTVAVLVAQPLGQVIQREVSTAPNLQGVRIAGIGRRESGRMVAHQILLERD